MNAAARRLLTKYRMAWIGYRYWNPFLRQSMQPWQTQQQLLQALLEQNQDTGIGREYGFASIKSYADYSQRVPVHDYEALRPYIERQEQEKCPSLNAEQPAFYVLTSGTTSRPKLIPITERTVDQYRMTQSIAAYAVHQAIPGAFAGKVLGIVSPAIEGHLETGAPYGSMSGLIYSSMPRLLRSQYLVPPAVFGIGDYQEKYRAIARLALAEHKISLIATANPSTLMQLHRTLSQHASSLLSELRAKQPARADRLQAVLDASGQLRFADLWPDLKAVTVWTGGSCGMLLPSLRALLPGQTRIVEVGYMSSEFRGTLIVDVQKNLEIPTLQFNFFEFVEQLKWESGDRQFLTLEKLQQGQRYYVFATTQNGLYRYNINDIVEVTGFFNQTPAIRFIQKGKGVVSLTGEKLYESQLLEAMHEFNCEKGTAVTFFVLLGCEETLSYTLFLELSTGDELSVSELSPDAVAKVIEGKLCQKNIEFDSKRASGRLTPLRAVFLQPGTGEQFKQHCLQAGQREGQFKILHLQRVADCRFDFMSHARDS